MEGSSSRRAVIAFRAVLLGGSLFLGTPASAAIRIIDVMPGQFNTETGQDSEPSIAVNPANPNQIIVHVFNGGFNGGLVPSNNPIFTSSDGGVTFPYNPVHKYTDEDATLAWSSTGTAYYAALIPATSTAPNAISVLASASPTSGTSAAAFGTIPGSSYAPGSANQSFVDQPWVVVSPVTSGSLTTDHIYTGFNDLSFYPGKTARVRYSTDGGSTWSNTVIETLTPVSGQDSPSIRVAARGNRVYAGYQRWNQSSGGNFIGDVVIVRDDAGLSGGTKFAALNGTAGSTVASAVILPWSGANPPFTGTTLGRQRLGSNLAMAVDPGNADRVLVAYTEVVSSQPVTRLCMSTDGGSTWQRIFSVNSASLPAVAVAANGTIGLLYASLVSGQLQTHFAQSGDNFTSFIDSLLNSFPNNTPAAQYDPYLGDFFDLAAVDNKFYGTFCVSNDPASANWPSGTPTYLRDAGLLGNGVAPSIDPFVFVADAVPEPGPLSLLCVATLGLISRRRRIGSSG